MTIELCIFLFSQIKAFHKKFKSGLNEQIEWRLLILEFLKVWYNILKMNKFRVDYSTNFVYSYTINLYKIFLT